eukprot:NODE_9413_length_643_cov_197.105769_g9147_i0.p1 GENE.NODE_9413_length_643_cov_197.105769_g9147_i0~~NODE_9413_length_643_cov_197.105769_g9147_i0.p1  ORF type:complete len:155 (-),score=54.03 NODE_9413_length_643_cov_197.105769_g9147_i0:178-582(-)
MSLILSQESYPSYAAYATPVSYAAPSYNYGAMVEVRHTNPPAVQTKLNVTPDRVEKLLENAYSKLEVLGTQLRSAAQELEDIRNEIMTANNLCDSELRSQLQQANDEIFKLRNQLSEAAERKANKMDRKDLMSA